MTEEFSPYNLVKAESVGLSTTQVVTLLIVGDCGGTTPELITNQVDMSLDKYKSIIPLIKEVKKSQWLWNMDKYRLRVIPSTTYSNLSEEDREYFEIYKETPEKFYKHKTIFNYLKEKYSDIVDENTIEYFCEVFRIKNRQGIIAHSIKSIDSSLTETSTTRYNIVLN